MEHLAKIREDITSDGNRILAFSNILGLYPLFVSWVSMEDTLTFLCILNVVLASTLSHLFECHKHGMPGYGLSPRTSYWLNRWDQLGCYIISARFIQLYITEYGLTLYFLFSDYRWIYLNMALIGYVCLRVSEYDKYNPDRKFIYIVFHLQWHIIIYYMLGLYMLDLF